MKKLLALFVSLFAIGCNWGSSCNDCACEAGCCESGDCNATDCACACK